MATRIEQGARETVDAIVESCAAIGEDVPTKLKVFRGHEVQRLALMAGVDPVAETISRRVLHEIDAALLELERPKAEA